MNTRSTLAAAKITFAELKYLTDSRLKIISDFFAFGEEPLR